MKRAIVFLVLALLLLAVLMIGCATPTPNVNPAEIAMTMAAQKMDAEATQMRIDIQYTATAQVVEATRNVKSTQAAVAVTSQARQDAAATDAQGRKDAAATEQSRRNDAAATEQRIRDEEATQQARRNAEATAEQGRQDVIGTATAQMVATWNAATMQVAPTHDLLTLQAAQVAQTMEVNDAQLSNLNVEQQTDKNTAEWAVPLLVVLAFVAVFAVVQIRRSRVREIKNEDDGTVVGLLVDGKTLIDMELMPGPVLDLSGKTVTAPEVTDKETQNEVTRRAQGVEALKALPVNIPAQMAAGLYNNVFGGGQEKPRIDFVEAEVVRDWVEDVTRQADEKEL